MDHEDNEDPYKFPDTDSEPPLKLKVKKEDKVKIKKSKREKNSRGQKEAENDSDEEAPIPVNHNADNDKAEKKEKLRKKKLKKEKTTTSTSQDPDTDDDANVHSPASDVPVPTKKSDGARSPSTPTAKANKSKRKRKEDISKTNKKMTDYFPVTPKREVKEASHHPEDSTASTSRIKIERSNTQEEKEKAGKKSKKATRKGKVCAIDQIVDQGQRQRSSRQAEKKKAAMLAHQESECEDQNQEPEDMVQDQVTGKRKGKEEKVDFTKQSTHQLLMHPNILSAGCVLLQNLKANTMTATEVGKKMGLKKGRSLRSGESSIGQSKIKRETLEPSGDSSKKKSKGKGSKTTQHEPELETDDSIDNSNSIPWNEIDENLGQPHEEGLGALRELIKRSAVTLNDEVDVDGDTRNGLTDALFKDIDKKKKLFSKHAKAIQKLTSLELKEAFAKILRQVAGIYNGSHPSIRHEKFKEGQSGLKELKDMLVTHPFNQVQSGTIIDLLYDSFFQDKARRYNWAGYVGYVLVPETFIRIYAYVNKLNNENAEKELLYSEEYEGPAHGHVRDNSAEGKAANERHLADIAESKQIIASKFQGATDEESLNEDVSEMYIDDDSDSSADDDQISAVVW